MKTKKKLQYNQNRFTTINQHPGTNTLNIASLNPGFFTTNEIQNDVINQLSPKKNTHRLNTRNTHTANPLIHTKYNYKITTSGAIRIGTCQNTGKGLHQGGAATLIHQDLVPYISTIKRIDRRIMTTTLQDNKTLTPITILTTYEPHKGYTATERNNTGIK